MARDGDNVVEKSARMPWYAGSSLLYSLETVYVRNDANHVDARFPVQAVIRPQDPTAPNEERFLSNVRQLTFEGLVLVESFDLMSRRLERVKQIRAICFLIRT